jgi:hypothetical protein
MITDQPIEHPAFIPSLVEALRRTEVGDSLADSLEYMFRGSPPFELFRQPADEWDYVEVLVAIMMSEPDLASASFMDKHEALVAGISIGECLALHRRS